MVLFLGDRELYDFLLNIDDCFSSEADILDADKLIVSEYSYNAVSIIRHAAENNIPVLGILDGYLSVVEAFGGECVPAEKCPEGKQELAILDTSTPLYKDFGHVVSICRGRPSALNEENIPPCLDCIARAETGEIIGIIKKDSNNVFAVNYYLNSALTEDGQTVILNFLNI